MVASSVPIASGPAMIFCGEGAEMNVLVVLLLPVVVLTLFIRVFLFQPFDTPSSSMSPTLVVGDKFFAAKYAYGYSRYSIPFSPWLFSGRILGAQPAYGDVVVFRLPKDTSTDYIKRVVGLPGDRVQMKAGVLYINGRPMSREQVFAGDGGCESGAATAAKRWRERLPNGASYETLDCVENGFLDNTVEYRVPAGHYFMMGDNRDNSSDSRVMSQVGYVPYENLVGRLTVVYSRSDER
jgi:signal peptidase I